MANEILSFTSKEIRLCFERLVDGTQLGLKYYDSNDNILPNSSDADIECVIIGEDQCLVWFLKDEILIFSNNEEEIMLIDENSRGHYTTEDTYGNAVFECKFQEMEHQDVENIISEIARMFLSAEKVSIDDVAKYEVNDHIYRQYSPMYHVVSIKSKEETSYIKRIHNIEFRVN